MQKGRALIMALAVLLPACGGGSGGESPPPADAAAELATPVDLAQPPASAASPPSPGTALEGGGTPAGSTQAEQPVVSDAQAHSPVGLWSGRTDGGRGLTGIVLADGRYYVVYTRADSSELGGLVQGTWDRAGHALRSRDARDFNMEIPGVFPASVTARAHARDSLSGSIQSGQSRTAFDADYQAEFEATASLLTLAGTFTGETQVAGAREAADITVGADGRFTGFAGSHCTLSGTMVPRTDGAVYDLHLVFGPAPCPHAGKAFEGISYLDTANRVLLGGATAVDAETDEAVLFLGRDTDPSLGQK